MFKTISLTVILATLSIVLGYHLYYGDDVRMLAEAKKAAVTIVIPRNDDSGYFSLGSGAILSEDGQIVTAAHIFSDNKDPKLILTVLSDHTLHQAKLIGISPELDLALIKIDAKGLKYLTFNEDISSSGEQVYAIGSPLLMEQTVSGGLLNRKQWSSHLLTYRLASTVTCNHGNSGGPLINREGQLVGVVQSSSAQRVGNQDVVDASYCYAVPDRVVQDFVENLLAKKKMQFKWLGAEYENIDYSIANNSGFKKVIGVSVTKVYPKTPAEKAGLKVGDIIVNFNHEEINSNSELDVEVNLSPDNESVPMVIWRPDTKEASSQEMTMMIEAQVKPEKLPQKVPAKSKVKH